MGLIPVSKRVIVKPDPLSKAQQVSPLIITPANHTKPSTIGTVVQVYKGCTELSKGDRVIWEQWSGIPIEGLIGDVTYLVVPFDKILGRFEHASPVETGIELGHASGSEGAHTS